MMPPHDDIIEYELEIQDRLSALTNYNKWIVSAFDGKYGRRILDVGSSIGNITQIILDRYDPELLVAIDSDEKAVGKITGRFGKKGNFLARKMGIDEGGALSLRAYDFDTITCFNVLEHIQDDTAALRNMREILAPNGRLILFVPAIQRLDGCIDKSGGHFRRYGRADLEEKISQAGFRTESIRYFNMAGILTWLAYGKVFKPGAKPRKSELAAADKLAYFTSRLEGYVNAPIGLSLACSCTR